jgi:predicted dithiol-disulfide oxidoreductase (DUF899 family)
MFADQVSHLAHLNARDTSFALVSRASHTYEITGRGVETLGSVWTFLDITPLGRQEEWEDSPEGYPQTPPYGWWRFHDEY